MGKYGLKIKNIEAGTLYEYNLGLREHYESQDAMFTNSLFYDFLLKNGMKVWKEDSTRDLICLEFNFGSRSFEEEIKGLRKAAGKARTEYRIARAGGCKDQIQNARQKRKRIASLFLAAGQRKDQYHKKSKEEIRALFYEEGVDVEYAARARDGSVRSRETIHYKMLYRSTGKAKKGSCMFIREKLWKKAIDFLYMGIRLSKQDAAIVEISAYAPLVSSTIIDRIQINPENILILKDVDRIFHTDVISVETDENKQCRAKRRKNYPLKNTLFDGQALIDSSLFPSWGNGYLLLRHHFCKMAAFCCRIQDFFQEYFGEDYPTATVKDMFGKEHFVKDIQLVTTDNAMKWLKFGVSYESWCQKVRENGSRFGIVKTAHESKLGEVQKMSYQMVNSLSRESMPGVVQESVQYLAELKKDTGKFLDYLEKNSNFSNDFEVLAALCRQNPDFSRSDYFRDRKRKIIEACARHVRSGKIIQNAENLVIVGSPFAMLLYGATGDQSSVDKDATFSAEKDAIQCYTERFRPGEYLAFFRSPFNSRNNLTCLHNIDHPFFHQYFSFGRQIVAVNLCGTDFQDRNNGSDQDSDSGYTTNQPDIVEHARRCYREYPTIVNNIPRNINTYPNTPDSYARIDSSLAKSQTDIGESSNLAQLAQTYSYQFLDPKYSDSVCILSVLAQAAIDSAKRRFDIDLDGEIKRIRKELDIKTHKYPKFWRLIKKDCKPEDVNPSLDCPMNFLCDLSLPEFRSPDATLLLSGFFLKHPLDVNRKTCRRAEELISKYSLDLYSYNIEENDNGKYLLLRNDFEDLIRDIRKTRLSGNYLGLFSWLIDRAFLITPQINKNNFRLKSVIHKNKSILLKTLYEINQENLLSCFTKSC